MEILFKDIRYSLRSLLQNRSFTIAAIITLALGIGANTAIFSVINAVMLRPLPYAEPERLVVLGESIPDEKTIDYEISYPNLLELQSQNQSFEQVAAFGFNESVLKGKDEPATVSTMLVSANFFSVLAATVEQGRSFIESEDRPGGEAVVVISHHFWQQRFGGDPDFIGKTINLDDELYTVIGIMPADFKLPDERIEVWMAVGRLADEPFMKNRAVHFLSAIARLKPDITLEQARADIETLATRIQQQYASEDPGHGLRLTTLQARIVGDLRTALLVLFAAVAFLLLIACTNVANLQLTRALGRQKELAIRAALGASRLRIVRQLLTESLILALCGGAFGVLLALWGVDVLVYQLPESFPRVKEIGVDRFVLGFALLVSVLSGVLFGLLPAVKAAGAKLNETLKDGGKALSSGRSRARNVLIITEVALSLILLIGAGLMMKSFWRLTNVNPGFQADHLLTLNISLPRTKYQSREQVINFYKQLPERLEAVPGVQAVSAVNALPISGGDSHGELAIEARPFNPGEAPAASFRRILPNYFRAMGIVLLSGREFDKRDESGAPDVTIINETMARRYWQTPEAAIGQRIKVGPAENEPWLTIIGVVGDVKHEGLNAEPDLATFEPHSKRPRMTMNLLVRTHVEPTSVLPSVRRELKTAESELLIEKVSTMTERIDKSVAPERLNAILLGIFAAVGLFAASIGIYGMLAFSVTQRTREIGIRLALGAKRADILKMVIGQGLRLVVVGIALGLLASLWLMRLMEKLLFEVRPTDLSTFAVISLILTGVALVACLVPARRATKVDPMIALRYE
ncbi:MAG: ABC transporter permease [Acidobacteriota bacterium]